MKFSQPAWLILLVLLPLLGAGALAVAQLRRKQWSEFVAPRLRPNLLKRSSPLPRWFSLLFLFAACAAIITALARPSGDAGPRTEKSLGRNVLIAIDLSRSMRVSDVKPDRLAQAKIIIYELLEAMPNERIGLLGFAGAAYEFAPLTVDHGAVRETVEQLDETWAPLGGSNLAEVVRLATETLKKTGQKNNALVIISDGEQNDGDLADMIDEAKNAGVFILTIGVGTEDGDYVPNADFAENRMVDRNGKPIISRLQSEIMRKLASETKGQYALAGSGTDIPTMVKSAIKDMDAFEMEGRQRSVSIEFYQWLLLPAIIFLLASIIAASRWKGVGAALAMGAIILTPNPARAENDSTAKNQQPLKSYQEATIAYNHGKYDKARSSFSKTLLTDDPKILVQGHIGMGIALFQQSWLELAGKSYPTIPEASPDMAKFDSLVENKLSTLGEGDPLASVDTDPYLPLRSLITNWTDAIRHFDSALVHDPSSKSARRNRDTVMAYLIRLQELLENEKQQTEQSMPQPKPDQGQPKPGEPNDGEPKQKPDDSSEKKLGKSGDDSQKPDDEDGDNQEKPDAQNGEKQDEPNKRKSPERKPNESPEDQAKRILKENSDLEKGPLTPGRREFLSPENDW